MSDFQEAPASATWRMLGPEELSQPNVQWTLRADKAIDLTKRVIQMIEALEKAGWTPAYGFAGPNGGRRAEPAPAPAPDDDAVPPVCPTHSVPMKPSKYGGWYCPQKIADDDGTGKPIYCRQKVSG